MAFAGLAFAGGNLSDIIDSRQLIAQRSSLETQWGSF
jgi:hypothetical protein